VTGTLGDAAAGLQLVARSGRETAPSTGASDARERLLARLHRPLARLAAGLALRDVANACIDVSDGLVADLGHVAAASGVGIEIDADRLPASSALLAWFDADSRLRLQLAGGDDYELAFSVPEAKIDAVSRDLARLDCGATRIGRVIAGGGVRVLDAAREEIRIDRGGWEHFS
jgi:thiamine-monophosphate kinase